MRSKQIWFDHKPFVYCIEKQMEALCHVLVVLVGLLLW
jgi:hypothetical protein